MEGSVSASVLTNTLIKSLIPVTKKKRVKLTDERLIFKSYITKIIKEFFKAGSSVQYRESLSHFIYEFIILISGITIDSIATPHILKDDSTQKMTQNHIFRVTQLIFDEDFLKDVVPKQTTLNVTLLKKLLKNDTKIMISKNVILFMQSLIEKLLLFIVSESLKFSSSKILTPYDLKKVFFENKFLDLFTVNTTSNIPLSIENIDDINEIRESSQPVNQHLPVRNAILELLHEQNMMLKCSTSTTAYIQYCIEVLVIKELTTYSELYNSNNVFKYSSLKLYQYQNENLKKYFKSPSIKRLCYKSGILKVTPILKQMIIEFIIKILYTLVINIVMLCNNKKMKLVNNNIVNKSLKIIGVILI